LLYDTYPVYNCESIKYIRRLHIKTNQLSSGVFWILSDSYDLNDYEILIFDIPCDSYGKPDNKHTVELNSKRGNNYNHKKLWENSVKNNNKYKPYNRKEYNYYPRGRVEISNNKAAIYLNPHLNNDFLIELIKQKFGLFPDNIPVVNVISDGSKHYQCFLDWN